MSAHVGCNDERSAFVKFRWSWESIYGIWKWCTCTLMYFCRARAEETASSICILGNCTRARLGLPRGRYPLKETEQMRVCPRGPSLRCFVEYFHISSAQSPIHRIMAENRSNSIDSCMVFIDVCTICLTTLQLSSAMRDTDICKREPKIIDVQFASFFFSRKPASNCGIRYDFWNMQRSRSLWVSLEKQKALKQSQMYLLWICYAYRTKHFAISLIPL